MSVAISLDENQPKDKDGKTYRHFSANCSILKQSGQKVKDHVPNTKALQARTVRCPNPSKEEKGGCWALYEAMIADKKSRGGTVRASKGSKQPPKQQGGKAGSIAAKAAAARKAKDAAKPAEKVEEKKEPVEATA